MTSWTFQGLPPLLRVPESPVSFAGEQSGVRSLNTECGTTRATTGRCTRTTRCKWNSWSPAKLSHTCDPFKGGLSELPGYPRTPSTPRNIRKCRGTLAESFKSIEKEKNPDVKKVLLQNYKRKRAVRLHLEEEKHNVLWPGERGDSALWLPGGRS